MRHLLQMNMKIVCPLILRYWPSALFLVHSRMHYGEKETITNHDRENRNSLDFSFTVDIKATDQFSPSVCSSRWSVVNGVSD